MNFANELCWGAAAEMNKRVILSDLRRGRFCPAVYVIALPDNEGDLLEIIPSSFLCNKLYRKTHNVADLKVLGIAVTRNEAVAVMRSIVEDVFERTGGFDIEGSFSFKF